MTAALDVVTALGAVERAHLWSDDPSTVLCGLPRADVRAMPAAFGREGDPDLCRTCWRVATLLARLRANDRPLRL